jgi:hypothetical protein
MGKFPMTRSIATSAIVAKLSVIMTESARRPDRLPSANERCTMTRLGWFARAILLLTMATMTWGNPL